MSGAFLDTNILVYAFTNDARAERAEALLRQRCAISVQVLNEFANVARRKLGFSWPELRAALDAIRALCAPVKPVDITVHELALDIAERHGFEIYDALIISAAIAAKCEILYSEDLSQGQSIGGLTVENPFLAK